MGPSERVRRGRYDTPRLCNDCDEYAVSYPAIITLVEEHDRLFPRHRSFRDYGDALQCAGYTRYRDYDYAVLAKESSLDPDKPAYVFIFFRDGDGYTTGPSYGQPVVPCYLTIPDLETLLTFAYHFHVPIVPETVEERADFVRSGYEFLESHLVQCLQKTKDEAFHAVIYLDIACQRAPRWAIHETPPLDSLHTYWRQVAPDDRLRFLVEMLTPNERRAICLSLDEED